MAETGSPSQLTLRTVTDGADVETVRTLLREYGHAINFALCLQGFERELRRLPGAYGPPDGVLLLAEVESRPAGCVGVRFFSGLDDDDEEDGPQQGAPSPSASIPGGGERVCEMKRLYVRPGFRGRGLGRVLAEAALAAAAELGYRRIRLETLEPMAAARALYVQLGFVEPAFPAAGLGQGMPCTATSRVIRVMERLVRPNGEQGVPASEP